MTSLWGLVTAGWLLWPNFNEGALGDLTVLSWGIPGPLLWDLLEYAEHSREQQVEDPG